MSEEAVSAPAPEATPAPVAEVSSENPVQVTPDVSPVEEVKPEVKVDSKLASRFASLSKKEKALEAKEKELAEVKSKVDTYESRKASAKEDPLKFLQEEHGISFEDLTNAILNGKVPESEAAVDPVVAKLKELEDKIAKQEALLKEKEDAVAAQENSRKRNEYKAMVETDMVEFPLTSAYVDSEMIIEKITQHYQEKGEIRPHKEVMAELEEYFESKLEAIAKLDKVKSRFGAPNASAPVDNKVAPAKQEAKVPVTLSNQAGGSPIPVKSVDDMSPSELREYQINKLKALRAK